MTKRERIGLQMDVLHTINAGCVGYLLWGVKGAIGGVLAVSILHWLFGLLEIHTMNKRGE